MKWVFSLFIFTTLSLVSCAASRRPSFEVTLSSDPLPLPPYQEVVIASPPFHQQRMERPLIILDAGHGGEDFGTHSLGTPRYQEKYLNLSTVHLVKNFLQQFGYVVILTRSDDTFIPLDKRAQFANERHPTVFVSIHYNSAPSKEAEGIEVYYFHCEEDKQRSVKSKALAQAILNKTVQNTKAKSRGVKHGNYAVIRETIMPSVLIEGGFLTNEREMSKIKDIDYQRKIALGIAQGIQEYLSKTLLHK